MTQFSVSTLGNQLFTTLNLQKQQSNLATLNEQLASGKQHLDLTDYAPVSAHNLMDFQNAIVQKQAYANGITTVNSRLSMYDTTMSDIESIAQQANTLATQNQTLDTTKQAQLQATAKAYLQQVQDDLNQKVSGRYIYAGSRYGTSPVVNLTTLAAPGLPFTPVTATTLPDYDSDYIAPGPTTSAPAYAQDSVTIDDSFTLQYGVTSNDPGFQKVIAGLRLINAASTEVVPANYQTDMLNASQLLSDGLISIQGTHATVANNTNILKQQTDNLNADITNLQDQQTSIQQVDMTSVGTQINLLQTQLQASYSATASLIQESILKYL